MMQEDIDLLQTWAENNNMHFNGSKFQLVRFGNNEQIKDETIYFTGDNTEIIDRFEKLRDLGVIMNEKANFEDHVTHVERKVRQKIGWISRTFFTRKTMFMKQIFKFLVIPHLDYCSQLWMPVEPADIEKIEKLQRDYFRKNTRTERAELLGITEENENAVTPKKNGEVQDNLLLENPQ